MGWFIAGCLLLLILASGGSPADGSAPPLTVPTETTVANPGGGHCGYGPNDDDVRGVIRAIPSTEPHC